MPQLAQAVAALGTPVGLPARMHRVMGQDAGIARIGPQLLGEILADPGEGLLGDGEGGLVGQDRPPQAVGRMAGLRPGPPAYPARERQHLRPRRGDGIGGTLVTIEQQHRTA